VPRAGQPLALEGRTDHEVSRRSGGSTQGEYPSRAPFPWQTRGVWSGGALRQVRYPRCCGSDVHKKVVVPWVLIPPPDGQGQKEVRPFSPMPQDLLALVDWLQAAECRPGAMESTSSYWRPVDNLWEGQFTVLVDNAYHRKTVPGRKTEVKDAEWIADLLRHG
jgi:hypothetical protein